MGLFDFAKNIGSKLFTNDAEAGDRISEHILANNPGIENLFVVFKKGQATLIGETDSVEAAQKAVLMAGNVKGVSEVIAKIEISDANVNASTGDSGSADAEVANILEPGNVEFYVIKSGDSLSKIAKKYYNNAAEYPRIFDANKEVIKDANLIYPGQKIRIPLD